MKKILLWSLGGLLVLGVVGFVILLNSLGPVVKTAVNSFGPKLTGTKVELADAKISPFSGSGTLTGLTVANPPGWKKEHAFTLGKITLALDPKSLAGSPEAAAKDPSGKPLKFEVKKFRLTNAKVALGVVGITTPEVPMPDIAMDNLGTKEGGIEPAQLFGAVLKNIGGNVITVGKDAVLKAGGAVVDTAKDAVKGVGDAAKGAVDGIKGLFGGDKK
jgi:hypothetical protein